MVKPQSGGLGQLNATTARRAFQIEFFTALPAKLDGKQSENLGGKDRDTLQYLALEHIAKKWTMPVRDWKAALQRFAILRGDRAPQSTSA